jgi:hypothetical protein
MEQYWLRKEDDWKHLRLCLNNHEPDWLYIRLVGSRGGDVKVNEDLTGRTLDFKTGEDGLHMLIDSTLAFHFPLEQYWKGFSLAYERFDDNGVMHIEGGIPDEPYSPLKNEPVRSFLRTVLDEHLMEIFFKGRVYIDFHSWWEEPYWKHWKIVPPKEGEEVHRAALLSYLGKRE